MALFTDQPLNKLIDLQNYENRILDVASTEGIDLAGKLALAQDEIANEVMMFLLRRLPGAECQWLPQPAIRQQIGVSDVVATAPLRQWHAYRTLAVVYRDAYNNQLNDRYQGKWAEYEQLAKISAQQYFQIGVGLVGAPVPRPGTPALNTITGNGISGSYYAAASWTGEAGQESSISEVAEASVSTGQQLTVAINSPPARATGWNVYIGGSPAGIARQNSSPIAIGTTWVVAGPLVAGPAAPEGQQPNWYVVDQRVFERG